MIFLFFIDSQEDKSVARIGIEDLPKIDFVATARSLALEALEELGGNKKKQGIK